MQEFITRAYVWGLYHGKRISSASSPYKIAVQHKYGCVCEFICEAFQADGAHHAESEVYYDGVQQLEWNHQTLVAVGYEIRTRYIDAKNKSKTKTNRGCALFFKPAKECGYLLRIPNPPICRVSKNRVITEFPILIAFEPKTADINAGAKTNKPEKK